MNRKNQKTVLSTHITQSVPTALLNGHITEEETQQLKALTSAYQKYNGE